MHHLKWRLGKMIQWCVRENTEKLAIESRCKLMSLIRMEVKRGKRLHWGPLWRNEGSLTSCIHKRNEGQRGITSKYMTVMIRYETMWTLSHKTNAEIQSQIFPIGESAKSPSHMKERTFSLYREWKGFHSTGTNPAFQICMLHLYMILPLSCWMIGYWLGLGVR